MTRIKGGTLFQPNSQQPMAILRSPQHHLIRFGPRLADAGDADGRAIPQRACVFTSAAADTTFEIDGRLVYLLDVSGGIDHLG
jgi:hypothetical protein